jgi:hypothetical protein
MQPPTIVNQPPTNLLLQCVEDYSHGSRLGEIITLRKTCDLSEVKPTVSHHTTFTKPRFSSAHLARLHNGEVMFPIERGLLEYDNAVKEKINTAGTLASLKRGESLYDVVIEQRTKPLSHGQRFKKSVDWTTILTKRDEQCINDKAQREGQREQKERTQEADWQRELATWPVFVPYNHDLKEGFCPHHVWSKSHCQTCAYGERTAHVVDYLATEIANTAQWETRLEAEGLPAELTDHNLSFHSSMQLDRIEHTRAAKAKGKSSPIENDYRASQSRKEVKPNTEAQRKCWCGELFVPTHARQQHHSENCRKQSYKLKRREHGSSTTQSTNNRSTIYEQ